MGKALFIESGRLVESWVPINRELLFPKSLTEVVRMISDGEAVFVVAAFNTDEVRQLLINSGVISQET